MHNARPKVGTSQRGGGFARCYQASGQAAGSPSARSAITGLGAGVGVGMGYTDCKVEFDTIAKASGK